jgi:tripartite-type tricarboxylate transporter receptor subunit TctC
MFARVVTAAFIAMGIVPEPLLAQDTASVTFPNKPVRIVVPFSPGSATDAIIRICAQLLTEQFGQAFVVENLGGAGGVMGSAQVARAAPDGHTLLAGSGAPITVNPYLIDNVPYDPIRDFAPITTIADSPMVVVVPKDSPIHSLKNLIDAAKANPGKLNYGSGGSGSAAHIAAEIFKWKTGTNLTHVPYRGVAAAVPDLVAGRLNVLFVSYPAVQPLAQSGALRLLAVATDKRSPLVPGAPTSAEQGVDDYVLSTWNGLMAPAKTSRTIIDKLNTALNKILRDRDVVARLAEMGSVPIPSTTDEFALRIRNELSEMEQLVKVAKIKER